MKNFNNFDIIVVGGGHAGIEAAWIAAQFDLKVCLITFSDVEIGSMPCNPAIGGVGKGQVVREIDALGGLMGKLADLSGIQYRTLNQSKGYAVQSTRVQVDKEYYSKLAEVMLTTKSNITIARNKVEIVRLKEGGQYVLSDSEGNEYTSKRLIITAGTFINAIMHLGEDVTVGGVIGKGASAEFDKFFAGVKLKTKRYKTGTPARLDSKTLNFSVMYEQKSDEFANNFHYSHNFTERNLDQVSCYLTRTNEKTLSIIRENKEKSPLFNGQIQGVGPRYCPSIEDKAFRYPDRNGHHVFIEPEGLDAQTIYPNGLSTSLPKEVQTQFLRTIEGLEKVEIKIYGYAVEYDVIDTRSLGRTLEHNEIKGLYFAGQVNGTSGYEEAAGQGIVAGINASLSLIDSSKELILDRNASYIGVMIEDLVTKDLNEPYRLFTARSENRLYVREDNAINRIFKYRRSMDLDLDIDKYQTFYMEEFNLLYKLCEKTTYNVSEDMSNYFKKMNYGPLEENITLKELVCRSKLEAVEVLKGELDQFGAKFDEKVIKAVAISCKYEGYINRAHIETNKVSRLSMQNIDWKKLSKSKNISFECRQRIKNVMPQTFSELKSINGIRPATLAYVASSYLK
ncbi:MAG: tRNA uridine-5-carboxymethylaminomethyl(34) synthesis enzyme MnmG [Bacteriovoracaceae bacterium]|nr:tRNA uridine-5-carboxymethylaminomethyl(34) synthesis enzyme MnmG [Bacteriovoracaceae bacterium]